MAKTEVAVKDQAALPAEWAGYEEYAGQGLDDITSEDKGLPFFDILQGQSPELDELKEARPGMIVNKATKELFTAEDGIRFVPVCRDHVYTEWVPREKGGGLVETYQLDHPVVKAARAKQRVGKHELPNGNELIETFYLYGMVLDADDNPTPAVISFTSTKIGAYKTLTTRADSLMFRTKDGRKLKFPWFAHVWRLRTEKKKKDNYSWYNWVVTFDGANDKAEEARLPSEHPAVQLGSDIYNSHRSGQIKVNTEGVRNEGGGDGGGYSGGGRGGNVGEDDDPPF